MLIFHDFTFSLITTKPIQFFVNDRLNISLVFKQGMQFGIEGIFQVIMENHGGTKLIPRTHSKALIVFSGIASFAFHPLLMTALIAFAVYRLAPVDFSKFPFPEFNNWFSQLLLYTVLLPLIFIFIFRISGLISDAKMHTPRDRILPLLATAFLYILAYSLSISHYDFPLLFRMLLLGSCSAIIVVFVINFFYKVSIHTTAAAILPGFSIILALHESIVMILPLLLALMVAAIVGIIRRLLGAHTMGQILFGYAAGILTQLAAYYYLNT